MLGDFKGAVELIDPESINQARSTIITLRQNARKYGNTEYLKQMDISYSDEELKNLSPQDFYVNVFMKIVVNAMQKDEQGKNILDGLKLSSNTVKVIDSKMLSNSIALVDLQFIDLATHSPNNKRSILKFNDSQWKIELGY